MKEITKTEEEYVHHIDLSHIKDINELESVLRARFGGEMDMERIKNLARAIWKLQRGSNNFG